MGQVASDLTIHTFYLLYAHKDTSTTFTRTIEQRLLRLNAKPSIQSSREVLPIS